LTPSPVIATVSPLRWKASTRRSFCSGITRANTRTRRTASASVPSFMRSISAPVKAPAST